MSNRRQERFNRRDLVPVRRAEEFQDEREPDFNIGDLVYLNSGGPIMLVVDASGREITVAWKDVDGIEEYTLTRRCFHRVRDVW